MGIDRKISCLHEDFSILSPRRKRPVNEQNSCEAASKREARFANGRGNLFRLRLAATHGTCGFVNGRPVNSGETIARSSE